MSIANISNLFLLSYKILAKDSRKKISWLRQLAYYFDDLLGPKLIAKIKKKLESSKLEFVLLKNTNSNKQAYVES